MVCCNWEPIIQLFKQNINLLSTHPSLTGLLWSKHIDACTLHLSSLCFRIGTFPKNIAVTLEICQNSEEGRNKYPWLHVGEDVQFSQHDWQQSHENQERCQKRYSPKSPPKTMFGHLTRPTNKPTPCKTNHDRLSDQILSSVGWVHKKLYLYQNNKNRIISKYDTYANYNYKLANLLWCNRSKTFNWIILTQC